MRPLFQRLSLLSLLFTLFILSGPFGCDDTTTIVVTCGDGFLDTGEECDDGNDVNGDACENDCTLPVCGNSILDQGETCDGNCPTSCPPIGCQLQTFQGGGTCREECIDAGLQTNCVNGDGCCPDACDAVNDSDCVSECGNGVTEPGEQCDTAGVSTACDADCTASECGDGVVNLLDGEECEDGNNVPSDGCENDCKFSTDCGDGVPESPEECDDGNDIITDGCIACHDATCGDGAIQNGVEECDDGNDIDTDACANCNNAVCGDGFTRTGVEQCDDGDNNNFNGCNNACTGATLCGDGSLDSGERCDDGDADNDDSCNNTCSGGLGCGNGFVDLGETCDDGDLNNTNECKNDCTGSIATPGCGNGVVEGGEDCDDGDRISGDECDACNAGFGCGNGALDGGEICDDGDTDNTDECNNSCSGGGTGCGDGVVQGVEECDDGNTITEDECDYGNASCNVCGADCTEVAETGNVCGDGVRDPANEACDDNNTSVCGTCGGGSGDRCSVVQSAQATGLILTADGSEIGDGETFTLNDGLGQSVVFEFDDDANSTGDVAITFSNSDTPTQVRDAIVAAINGEAALLITASPFGTTNLLTLTHDRNTSLGNQAITHTVSSTSFAVDGMSGGAGGDCLDGDGCAAGADCASGVCTNGSCEGP